ncbi:alpha/beta family hydrolase [Hyphomicrobium sp.]|uniref:alpha/beta family hydrolase n=1 Tax=Hyphomicrobium sp. TaxID=82 RepID=UPI002D782B67|nr:alpha/beta family hydrolase [Hyphomicrobium sp.]HET6390203.1 alpha/beta family hydrolase [Hyphomicrobium sp.]
MKPLQQVTKPPAKGPASGPHTVFRIDTGISAAKSRLILAHGAGAGITSSYMDQMASLLSERGIALTLFEFAYMSARREGGPKRPPPKAEKLIPEFRDMVSAVAAENPRQELFIGGKSMGGRVASMLADELYAEKAIGGLVCLGYPFHAPGTPDKLRIDHLTKLRCPALIVQGERDPFGNRSEIEKVRLSKKISFAWISDGDHDFGPRGNSGFTRKGNLAAAADAVAAFTAKH